MKRLLLNFIITLLTVTLTSVNVYSQATITTDQFDYLPGTTCTITGTGFQAGESVTLKVKNLSIPCHTVFTDSTYTPWSVTADSNGEFSTTWTVCQCPGTLLRAKAVGQSSGEIAFFYFTDATYTTRQTGNWNSGDTWKTIRTGTITTSTASTTVTGVGTFFTTELSVGDPITNGSDVLIGTVASITNDNVLVLTGNAASTNAGIAYGARKVPLATDDVIISGAVTITVTADATCKTLTYTSNQAKSVNINNNVTLTVNGALSMDDSGNGVGWNLNINSGKVKAASLVMTGGGNGGGTTTTTLTTGTLDISGAVTLTPNNAAQTITVGTGIFNAGSISLIGAATPASLVTASTGTINVTGNISFSGTASRAQLTFTGAGILNLGGNLGSGGTFTAGSSTVNLNGSGAQSILGSYTFNNLTVKSTSITTATGTPTMNAAGTFTIENSGTYIHNNLGTPSSTIFAGIENFGPSSNFRIDNWPVGLPAITTGVTLPFGNLEIAFSTLAGAWQQALSGSVNLTAGNFTISNTNAKEIRLTTSNGTPLTLGIGGSLSVGSNSILSLIGSGTGGTNTSTVNVGGNVSISGTGIIDMNGGSTAAAAGSATLNVGGDFSITGSGILKKNFSTSGGTVNFNKLNGLQTFTSTATGINTSNLIFNIGTGSSTNTLQLLSSFIPANGSTLNILSGSKLYGIGNLTLSVGSGGVSNAGTIELNGNTTACPESDDILIRSTTAGAQRAWTGAGVFNLKDVNVQDQGIAGGAAINVFSGTNNGNNGSNWNFVAGCSLCSVTASITSQTNVDCFGNSTGSVTVAGANGTSPYTYSTDGINFSNTTGIFSGLAAGSYTVTVKDANNCTTTQAVSITQPAAVLAASETHTDVNCFGGSTGTATIIATGGTSPYTVTGAATTGLAAGTYNYTVTDNKGCTTTISVTISQPAAALAASETHTDVNCFGASTGTATISATGGTAPYSGTGTFSGLAAGTYSYTVTDAKGCTSNVSVTITQPTAALIASETHTDVNCFGGSTGSATISATGGTAPYTGTGTLSGLAAGTYSYTVTDAKGCTSNVSVTIAEPAAALVASETHTDVNCFGGSTGSATISATGGTAPYTGTGTFSGLAAGTYSYTVTDAKGCTSMVSVTIAQPAAALAASETHTDVNCFGGSTGSATISATGGTAPYSGTGTFSGLAAGTYSYTVTDAKGCTSMVSVTINQPAAALVASETHTNVTCASQGSATISATGGTAPYSGTGTFNNLAAGTYSYTVTDAKGCTSNVSVTISQPAGGLTATETHTDVSCFGGSNGTATISATGGQAPYSGTGTFTNLAAGTHTYTVTDANSCTSTVSVTIGQPAALVASETHTNVSCFGGSNGTATISATGGTAPYSGTGTFTGLPAGTYSYTVTDANSCTSMVSVTIGQPDIALSATSTATAILCYGGTSTVTVAGHGGTAPYTGTGMFTVGAGPYSYTVTDANGCTATTSGNISQPTQLTATASEGTIACYGGSTTVTITAAGGTAPYSGDGAHTVSAGAYSFTVTDANGCTKVVNGNISQPTQLTATAAEGTIACFGGSTTVTITAAGGTAPYTNDGAHTVSAGAYSFTVTDANGCSTVVSGNISQPTQLTATATEGRIACYGGSTTVTITAEGGTAPYSGDGAHTVSAGAYSFTVTDANGCSTVVSGTISQPTQLTATASEGTIACFGGSTTVTITAAGGTAPYTNDGAHTVGAGAYSFTVTDANGCSTVVSGNISQPTQLTATVSEGTIACFGGSTTVTITAAGGTAPYSGDGAHTVSAGAYSFTVTDANGCTKVVSGNISQPTALSASSSTTAILCNGGSSTVTVSATGGTSPYTGTGTFSRTAGTYNFTVTDANGCSASTSITIGEPTALSASSSATAILCNGGSSTVTVSATGGTSPYTGTGTFSRPAGTYNFTVTDANGCSASTSITIGQPAALSASSSATAILCNGGSSTVTVTAAGGTTPYTGTGTFTVTAGTYTYTVSDANGCTTSTTITVSQPAALVASSSATAILCNGGSSTVTVSATGGTSPYTGTGTFTVPAGTYTYNVSDANGCTTSTTITVTQPSAISLSTTQTDVNCFNGNNGSINLTVSGGTTSSSSSFVTVSENFDRAAFSSPNTTWNDGVTIPNWKAIVNNAVPGSFIVGSGTGTGGGIYSFGSTGAPDRAIGSIASGSTNTILGAWVVTNTTGQTVSSVNVTYTGEQWRNGGNATSQKLAFDYQKNAPGINSGSWTTNTSLDFTSLINTTTAAALDGNASANRATITASLPITLLPGETVWLRWTDVDNSGADHGLAIDDLSAKLNYTSNPYTFLWSNGATTEDISSLTAGTYSVTVKDANNCSATTSVTITQPAVLANTHTESNFNGFNIGCNGGSNGSINLTVTGGTTPYSYAWTGVGVVAAAEDQNGLKAGTYNVTVTDAKGCTTSATITLTQPTAVSSTNVKSNFNGFNISCNGGNNGTINLTPAGGVAPYTYAWTGTGVNATAEDQSGLTAGTYNVTITDANSCTATAAITLTQPTVLANTHTESNISCNGGNNGSIDLTVTGGVSPYAYAWTGTGVSPATQDQSGLTAGTYSVVITDANGCTSSASITLTQPTALALSTAVTNVNCFGQSTGAINLSVTGGTPFNPGGTVTYTQDFNTLAFTGTSSAMPAGWFFIESGSLANTSYTANAGSGTTGDTYSFGTGTSTDRAIGTLLSGSLSSTIGAGSTFINTTGATVTSLAIQYAGEQWRLGTSGRSDRLDFQYSTNATAINNGSWTDVNALDFSSPNTTAAVGALDGNAIANRTIVSGTITGLSIPSGATFWIRWNDLDATSADDGLAVDDFSMTMSSASTPYTYTWTGAGVNPTSEDQSGLAAGTYSVVVKDANNCTASTSVTITQPIQVTVSATKTNVSCFGAADGTITASASAGATITVDGNPYVASAIYGPGTYTVTATAPNGNNNGVCTASTTVTISQPIQVTVSATSTNVSCFGLANGTITASASAGASITVNGNPYVASATYGPGTYTITATAQNGNNNGVCSASTTVSISEPIQVTVSATSTNVSCFGAADGTITASSSAGSTITVNGNPYVASATYGPGTYTVTATAPNGNNNGVCSASTTVTISQPIQVTVSASSTNVSCNGRADGTITASASAGASITVNGNPYVASATYGPGTYTVTATAPNGNNNGNCTATTSVTITEPIEVTVSATSTNVSCYGAADGTITASSSAGSTITVNGNPYVASATYGPGTYTVTATAANGNNNGNCTASTTVTISQPIQVTVSATSTNVSCYGAADGTITASSSAGSTITVNGNPYVASATYGPGTYTVTATAANGNNNGNCTASTTVTISQPIQVTVSATSTNVSCNGRADGTITASSSAGSIITVNGNPYVASATYGPGTYTVTATAPNGNNNGDCTATTSVTITEPIEVTVSATSTNVSCYGAADGTITASGSAGSTITVNGNPYVASATYGPGTYTVTATAPNGNNNGNCTASTTVTISQPIQVTVSATSTNVSCNGRADGTITASSSAGSTITVNGNPYVASATYGPGTYTVTATAANGNNNGNCTATTSVTITEPIEVTVSATSTNVSCYGAADGTITASASAGANITVNGNPYVASATYGPGTYTVTATAANGNNNGNCTATTSVTITEPIEVTVSATSTNVSCYGAADGTITASASAGATITVNGNPYVASATYGPGTYTVTASAANGNNNGNCTASTTVTISQPIQVTVSATSTNVSCYGASDGTITASASAGATITVNGNPYVASATYGPGTYTVTATAANGNNNGNCTASTTVTIGQPIQVTVSATSTNVSCYGAADGTITASGSAGSTITVNGNPYVASATYGPGTYTVVATAPNGNNNGDCTASTTVTISQPIQVTISATSTNVSCYGAADGTITASASAGASITVNGNPYVASATYGPGTYTVTATAANGNNNGNCTASTTVTISQPIQVTVSATSTNVSCYGAADGTITASSSAGSTITVNGNAYVASATYGPGTYTVTATAANGNNNGNCTASTTVTISQPIQVTISATSTNVSCYGAADGTITASASAGASITVNGNPYVASATYGPGTYTVTATAANGNNNGNCAASTTVTISQPIQVTISATSTNVSCYGAADGTITASASAGASITVNGNPYVASATYGPGTYTVTATAANGNNNGNCTASTTVTISQPIQVTISATSTNVSCYGAADGTITASASAGASITVNGNPYVASATYGPGTYTVTATAANGNNNGNCTASTTVTISQPIQVTVSATSTNVSCYGASDGTITASASAGATITVNGNPYVASATYGPGTYTVTATAANGNNNGNCTASTTVTISQPIQVTVSATSTNVSCYGAADGTITASASAGASITVNGNPYIASATYGPGTYTVTATAANGNNNGNCTASTTVTISQPIQVTVSATSTNVSCYGAADGTITASGSAGSTITVNGNPYVASATYGPGTYTVTATAPNGNNNGNCTATTTITITQPTQLTASKVEGSIACNGGTTTVTITAAGGTAPYTNDGAHTVSAGAYSFTVTDAHGCTVVVSGTISQPTPLVASKSYTPIMCYGDLSTVTISGSGGTAPYTYTNGTTPNSTGIFEQAAGTVTYTVTDANGCTKTISVMISQPTEIIVSSALVISNYNGAQVSCNGSSNGTIKITATGGTGTLTYTIGSTTNTTGLFTNLPAGSYTYTVRDANSCAKSAVVTISQPAPIVVTETHTAVACQIGGISTVTISATGGTGAYSGTGTFSQAPGEHTYIVTDVNGCSTSLTLVIIAGDYTAPTFTKPADITIAPTPGSSCYNAAPSVTGDVTNEHDDVTPQGPGLQATYTDVVTECGYNTIIKRKWHLADGCGNVAADQIQIITITDNATPYIIYAVKEAKFGQANVINGSVGVSATNGTASFQKNSQLLSPEFVRAVNINVNATATVNNKIYSAANDGPNPIFYPYTGSTSGLGNYTVSSSTATPVSGNYKKLTIKKDVTVTISGTQYGKIEIETGAQVTFSPGGGILNIESLKIKGKKTTRTKIKFGGCTSVRIKDKVDISEHVWLNEENKRVTFYLGDDRKDEEKFMVHGGDTRITANIYIKDGKLKVNGGDLTRVNDKDIDGEDRDPAECTEETTFMTGWFIAEKVESDGKNIEWNRNACTSGGRSNEINQIVKQREVVTGDDFEVLAFPNPTTTNFRLLVKTYSNDPISVRVFDAMGRLVTQMDKLSRSAIITFGDNYTQGTYFAEITQGKKQKQVKLIKYKKL